MTKYIEYFQVEAKCLLKDFKKNIPEAKSHCKKYFESKDDISLMNAQHVIAKEYGFDSCDYATTTNEQLKLVYDLGELIVRSNHFERGK